MFNTGGTTGEANASPAGLVVPTAMAVEMMNAPNALEGEHLSMVNASSTALVTCTAHPMDVPTAIIFVLHATVSR